MAPLRPLPEIPIRRSGGPPVFEAAQISICRRLLQNWLPRPKFTKFQWVEWLITAQLAIWRGAHSAACQIRAAKGKTGYQPYPVQRTIRLYRRQTCSAAGSWISGKSCAPDRPKGQTGSGRRRPGDFPATAMPKGTMPKCAAETFTLPPPPRKGAAKGGPAGTRRLDGCTKGRDARRSQTASRPAGATGISRSGPRTGCTSGSAGCPRPFITEPVHRRAAPSWCRRDRPDQNNRRGCAACRTHDFATDRSQRCAPRRTPLWERKC